MFGINGWVGGMVIGFGEGLVCWLWRGFGWYGDFGIEWGVLEERRLYVVYWM